MSVIIYNPLSDSNSCDWLDRIHFRWKSLNHSPRRNTYNITVMLVDLDWTYSQNGNNVHSIREEGPNSKAHYKQSWGTMQKKARDRQKGRAFVAVL